MEENATLIENARKIRGWQLERKILDEKMVSMFRGLGSSKTYTRIVAGDLEELDAGRWARNYETVLNVITTLDEHESSDDPLYDDLTTVMDLRAAVTGAMREKGNNRLVILQGPSGIGKTTAAFLVSARFGARIVLCEASELWKENANAMLGGILRALGVKHPPTAVSAKLDMTVAKLNESRVCLVIDEAHHLGPRTLNLIKSLLNQTPGEFVLLAMATLWHRLETQAYAEARQLTGNRLSERLRFEELEESDVALILERRLGIKSATDSAKTLAHAARSHGHMAFVKLVCRRARKLAGKGIVTTDIVDRAAADVAATR